MRKALVTLLGVALVCSLVFADEGKTEAKTEKKMSSKNKSEILNNVVKMDKDGNLTAVCGCGMEFTVTDPTLAIKNGDMTMYCHNQMCHDAAAKMSKEESDKMMKDWHKKYMTYKLADNTFMKDGKKMATCLCGKTLDVTKSTPHIRENGVNMYLCSDACASQLHGMSDADRLGAEKKVAMAAMTSSTPEAAPVSK
jgi:hypothetical protein